MGDTKKGHDVALDFSEEFSYLKRSINTVWDIISEEMRPHKIQVFARKTPSFVLEKVDGCFAKCVEFTFDVGIPSFDKAFIILLHMTTIELPEASGTETEKIVEKACSIIEIKRFYADDESIRFELDTYFIDKNDLEPHPCIIGLVSKAKATMSFDNMYMKIYECLVKRNDYKLRTLKRDTDLHFQ